MNIYRSCNIHTHTIRIHTDSCAGQGALGVGIDPIANPYSSLYAPAQVLLPDGITAVDVVAGDDSEEKERETLKKKKEKERKK